MAQPYGTGALAVFVNTSNAGGGTAQAAELLGFGEKAPRMEVDTKYGRVMCDLTGQQIPYDFSFDGCIATISMNLTVFSNRVASQLETRPGPRAFNPPFSRLPGLWRQSDYGALIAKEGYGLQLSLRYLNASGPTAKTVYTTGDGSRQSGGLVGGYRFFHCLFGGPWENETGTIGMKRQFIFLAWPGPPDASFVPPNGGGSLSGNQDPFYVLYDNNMAPVENLSLDFF